MAIAIDTTPSTLQNFYSSTAQTYNFTASALANAVCVVSVHTDATRTFTVTVNSVAATLAKETYDGIISHRVDLFVLALGASYAGGTVSIQITPSAGGNARFYSGAAAFSGVSQSTPTNNTASHSIDAMSGQTSFSTNITCAAGNMVVDAVTMGPDTALTKAGSQTEIFANANGGGGENLRLAFSYLLNASSMGWSFTNSTINVAHAAIELVANASGILSGSGGMTGGFEDLSCGM